jgi:hypothetical protein
MYRCLILADVPGWAYDRRATALKKYAPPDFEVDVHYMSHLHPTVEFWRQYDLVFNLEYAANIFSAVAAASPETRIVTSFNRNSQTRADKFQQLLRSAEEYGFLILNNREIFDFYQRPARTCNISNGVDGEFWQCLMPIQARLPLALWCGSGNPAKGKGYHDVLLPAKELLEDEGMVCYFRAYESGPLEQWALPPARQRDWYNTGIAILCSSLHEGTPNTTLEGMSCGCVPITTPVGNALEFGVDGVNCIFCERTPQAFVEAMKRVDANRESMSQEARHTIRQWYYGPPGNRALYYFALFRRLIEDGPDAIEPFCYAEVSVEEI